MRAVKDTSVVNIEKVSNNTIPSCIAVVPGHEAMTVSKIFTMYLCVHRCHILDISMVSERIKEEVAVVVLLFHDTSCFQV